MFPDYDGVPWNNNNTEHAIKRFVQLRKAIGGSSTAKGIQEYLIFLSLCETLRLRNASFLKFLISGAADIDKFLETKRTDQLDNTSNMMYIMNVASRYACTI